MKHPRTHCSRSSWSSSNSRKLPTRCGSLLRHSAAHCVPHGGATSSSRVPPQATGTCARRGVMQHQRQQHAHAIQNLPRSSLSRALLAPIRGVQCSHLRLQLRPPSRRHSTPAHARIQRSPVPGAAQRTRQRRARHRQSHVPPAPPCSCTCPSQCKLHCSGTRRRRRTVSSASVTIARRLSSTAAMSCPCEPPTALPPPPPPPPLPLPTPVPPRFFTRPERSLIAPPPHWAATTSACTPNRKLVTWTENPTNTRTVTWTQASVP